MDCAFFYVIFLVENRGDTTRFFDQKIQSRFPKMKIDNIFLACYNEKKRKPSRRTENMNENVLPTVTEATSFPFCGFTVSRRSASKRRSSQSRTAASPNSAPRAISLIADGMSSQNICPFRPRASSVTLHSANTRISTSCKEVRGSQVKTQRQPDTRGLPQGDALPCISSH